MTFRQGGEEEWQTEGKACPLSQRGVPQNVVQSGCSSRFFESPKSHSLRTVPCSCQKDRSYRVSETVLPVRANKYLHHVWAQRRSIMPI